MGGTFRLRMATQMGEKLAREEGYQAFPVNPIAIAERHDIHVEKKPPGMAGVSGALIFAGPKPILIYSTEHLNEGFENFSVSHELGHYFLPDHPDQIIKSGGQHFSRAGFSEGDISIELEADHFAAGLMMPEYLVRKELDRSEIGLAGILQLASEAKVSVTASAIRVAECAAYPLCIVVSEGGSVRYAFPSESFKRLGNRIFLRKGAKLPERSTTAEFNENFENIASGARVTGDCDLIDWFDTDRRVKLDEQVIGLGRYGLTLTVLSSDALADDPDDSDQAEEEALLESWAPKFAYGR